MTHDLAWVKSQLRQIADQLDREFDATIGMSVHARLGLLREELGSLAGIPPVAPPPAPAPAPPVPSAPEAPEPAPTPPDAPASLPEVGPASDKQA